MTSDAYRHGNTIGVILWALSCSEQLQPSSKAYFQSLSRFTRDSDQEAEKHVTEFTDNEGNRMKITVERA